MFTSDQKPVKGRGEEPVMNLCVIGTEHLPEEGRLGPETLSAEPTSIVSLCSALDL